MSAALFARRLGPCRSRLGTMGGVIITLALALAACSEPDPAKLVESAQRHLDRDEVAAALVASRGALKQQPQMGAARLTMSG